MSQNYSFAPARRAHHTVVCDVDSPTTIDAEGPWVHADVLRGIEGGQIDKPLNHLTPESGSSSFNIDLNSHIPSTPNWQYTSSYDSTNYNPFQPDPPTHLSSTESPWTPLQVTGVPAAMVHQSKRQRTNGNGVSTSRQYKTMSPDVRSHADSGYGTKITGPVGGCQMDDASGRSLLSPNGSTMGNFTHPHDQYMLDQSPQEHNWHGDDSVSTTNDQYPCDVDGCPWTGKCPSDKKKHMLRHEKKFLCREPGCNRTQGFGTINDLERHQKCVHGIEPKHGSNKQYKCFAEGCSKAEKDWPRLDNFKQHLIRMHPNVDQDGLLRMSNAWHESTKQTSTNSLREPAPSNYPIQPQLAGGSMPYRAGRLPENRQWRNEDAQSFGVLNTVALTVPGSISGSPMDGLRSLRRSYDPSINSISVEAASRDFSSAVGEGFGETTPHVGWGEHMLLHDQGLSHLSQSFEGYRPSSPLVSGMRRDHAVESLADAAVDLIMKKVEEGIPISKTKAPLHQNGNGTESSVPVDLSTPSSLDLLRNTRTRDEKEAALRQIIKASILQLKTPEPNPEPQLSSQEGEQGPETGKDNAVPSRKQKVFKCTHPGCPRETKRQCEMKKHMKRHQRPYGCTYSKCFKKFGSKNDWKRHENTQHFQLQSWRCPVKLEVPDEPMDTDLGLRREDVAKMLEVDDAKIQCATVFDRGDKFAHHLRIKHGYDDLKIKEALKANKIGRNGQFQFWCGFCRKLISLQKEGLDAWEERFTHIDGEHFRKGQDIADWLPPEGHLTKQHKMETIAKESSLPPEDREGNDDEGSGESCAGDEPPKPINSFTPVGPPRNKTTLKSPASTKNSGRGRPRLPKTEANNACTVTPMKRPNPTQATIRRFPPDPSNQGHLGPRTVYFHHHPPMMLPPQQMPRPIPNPLGRRRQGPPPFNPSDGTNTNYGMEGLIYIQGAPTFSPTSQIKCCQCYGSYVFGFTGKCIPCQHDPCGNCTESMDFPLPSS
ncbi:hypothetical protein FQN55_003001 [Onygenales sp. PD_40]|nr:hypothetical protein FQN55_003001 [Onygenales sp. PD_40]